MKMPGNGPPLESVKRYVVFPKWNCYAAKKMQMVELVINNTSDDIFFRFFYIKGCFHKKEQAYHDLSLFFMNKMANLCRVTSKFHSFVHRYKFAYLAILR